MVRNANIALSTTQQNILLYGGRRAYAVYLDQGGQTQTQSGAKLGQSLRPTLIFITQITAFWDL